MEVWFVLGVIGVAVLSFACAMVVNDYLYKTKLTEGWKIFVLVVHMFYFTAATLWTVCGGGNDFWWTYAGLMSVLLILHFSKSGRWK